MVLAGVTISIYEVLFWQRFPHPKFYRNDLYKSTIVPLTFHLVLRIRKSKLYVHKWQEKDSPM